MRTTGDVYLWPAAAERKLRMAYQAGLPAYLYGVTGVGKTSLIRHFLEKKEYFYVSALNTTPDDLESEKITAPVIVLDDLYAISDIRLKDAYYQKIQEWMERNDLWVVLISRAPFPAWLLSLRMKYSFVMIGERCVSICNKENTRQHIICYSSCSTMQKRWNGHISG